MFHDHNILILERILWSLIYSCHAHIVADLFEISLNSITDDIK